MFDLLWQQRNIRLSEEERRTCLEFYVENAPDLPPDTSDVAKFFRKIPLGHPVQDSASRPAICNVAVGDLDQNRQPDIVALITQEFEQIVAFINQGGAFAEHVLFEAHNPAFGSSGIELVDLDQDADLDILFTIGDSFDGTDAKLYHGV